jgi:hypothetical protein
MSIRRFRRHAPPCLDAAIHSMFDTLTARPALRGAFTRLLTISRARSDLLRDLPPARRAHYPQLTALRNLAGHHRDFIGDPLAWSGAPGRHPLAIIDSLARHVLGRYPTPRFLASVWFGGGDGDAAATERRGWYIAHARGRRFRDLRLPIAMTRRIEHAFLHSPDHLAVDRALRRAEVIGVGGSPELADAVAATQLGSHFDRPALWRDVIAWLVRRGDEVDLAWLPRIIAAIRAAAEPPELADRSFETVRRDIDRPVAPAPRQRSGVKVWRPASWQGAAFAVGGVHWQVCELTDSAQLVFEGRMLHHCVARYARHCLSGGSQIWSLRRSIGDGRATPVLTIEVNPRTQMIIQIRGERNQRAAGLPLALVRQWAERERLRFLQGLSDDPPPRA